MSGSGNGRPRRPRCANGLGRGAGVLALREFVQRSRQVVATLRNLSIGIFKMAGHTSIATACRHHARDATRTLATLGLSPP